MRIKNLFVEILIIFCVSSMLFGQKSIVRSDMTFEKAEKLADQIARDFEIRNRIRDKIIYEDYRPVTLEQRYCEDSKTAKNILQRSKNPNGFVYAIAEYDKNGYFIVFGQYVLNNPSIMVEVVIHEMTHLYCYARGLNQGDDEHSEDYLDVHKMIYDYVSKNLNEILAKF